MDSIIYVVGFIGILGVAIVAFMMLTSGNAERGQISSMLERQRSQGAPTRYEPEATPETIEIEDVTKSNGTSLQDRLKYGQWPIPPVVFYLSQILVSAVVAMILQFKFDWWFVIATLFSGPVLMNYLLNKSVTNRFNRFDRDYAPFLLQLVSMLKTGMNTMTAMSAAAEGLDEDSLVREEVELMVERLRFGVTEESSIGSFGETINHPEIELFVQALLLSRKVGGTLSDTLERLSKQVRKRQFFRESAQGAVGMQRGSLWLIIGIVAALEGYLYFTNPDFVTEPLASDLGWTLWQVGFILMIISIYWMSRVTKIRL